MTTSTARTPKTVPLADAARQLGISWPRAWRMLLEGQLDGQRTATGRWLVTQDSIARVQQA